MGTPPDYPLSSSMRGVIFEGGAAPQGLSEVGAISNLNFSWPEPYLQ
jgi:hypothetical protein